MVLNTNLQKRPENVDQNDFIESMRISLQNSISIGLKTLLKYLQLACLINVISSSNCTLYSE